MNNVEKIRRTEIINNFHLLHYYEEVCMDTYWLGVQVLKTPEDLMIIQEIIYEIKPDVIIETGTHKGGSALYMASILDLIGHGKIITVDVKDFNPPEHKRITYLVGSSIEECIYQKVKSFVKKDMKVLVLLDSAHTCFHVEKELELYSKLVSKDSYLICEDTNLSGNPVEISYSGGGPMTAVREFMEGNDNFIIDKTKEKYLLTYFPNGFLKRVK